MSTTLGELTASEAIAAGLLIADPTVHISTFALFCPTDDVGASRCVTVGAGAVIGAFTVVHGGTVVAEGARVEDHVVIGQPERGYALREHHRGEGATTRIGADTVVRGGARLYAGVELSDHVSIGHNCVLRSHVRVGPQTLLGHGMTIERQVRIGAGVRCSPGTHLTAETVLEDAVFLGAGIRTVNDKTLRWQPGGGDGPLIPPYFAEGARVGSGAVILGGVRVGPSSLVGAGAVVTHDVDPGAVVVGNPAKPLSRRGGGR